MAASQPTISGCCGVCAGKTQMSKVTRVSRNFDHTPDFQGLGHRQRTVEAGVCQAEAGRRLVACIRSRQAAGTAATTGAARFLSSTCKTLILRKRPLQSPDESNTGNAVSSPLPFKGRLSVSDPLLRKFFKFSQLHRSYTSR